MITYYITVKEALLFDAQFREKNKIEISPQKTGFGTRYYMICPSCKGRRMRLYISKSTEEYGFLCRNCYPGGVYRNMTNQDTGSTRNIRYRMERLCKKAGVTPEYPFNPWSPSLIKPDHISWNDWGKFIRRMTILESMRTQSRGAPMAGLPKKRYSTKTIKYYMDEIMNIDLTLDELLEMRDWDEHVP